MKLGKWSALFTGWLGLILIFVVFSLIYKYPLYWPPTFGYLTIGTLLGGVASSIAFGYLLSKGLGKDMLDGFKAMGFGMAIRFLILIGFYIHLSGREFAEWQGRTPFYEGLLAYTFAILFFLGWEVRYLLTRASEIIHEEGISNPPSE